MDENYVGTKEKKVVLAKSIMEHINSNLMELGYKGALATAAPAREIQALETYSSAGFGASIFIKTKQRLPFLGSSSFSVSLLTTRAAIS